MADIQRAYETGSGALRMRLNLSSVYDTFVILWCRGIETVLRDLTYVDQLSNVLWAFNDLPYLCGMR